MSRDWYGDFSTYGFASGVEWLGYSFATTVNVSAEYTDELLAEYDVLILKTPQVSMEPEEVSAVQRFVQRGGGLLLLGDHTDLFGSSRRLNVLAGSAGLRFRFDSVSGAAARAFRVVEFEDSGHPAGSGLTRTEFMTGCSIGLEASAEPLGVAGFQVCELADFGGGSNFGVIGSDPRCHVGPAVSIAEGRIGLGRVIAHGDSTSLSSFALFKHDRERLLLNMVAWLNTRRHPLESFARWLALGVGLLCLTRAAAASLQLQRTALAACLVAATLAGVGAERCAAAVAPRVAPPPPVRAPPRASVFVGDSEALFPPVLGSLGDLDPGSCYDTWLTVFLRDGVFPRLVASFDAALGDEALVVLNPRDGIGAEDQARLGEWLEQGGRLVVLHRDDHLHAEAIGSYLAPAGLSVSASPAGLRIDGLRSTTLVDGARFEQRIGAGAVVVSSRSEDWSRAFLGNALAIPGREAREAYARMSEIVSDCLAGRDVQRRTYRILEDE